MKRLLTHSQLKHTKQAANKFLTCFIAAIMAVALSLPAAGIPTLSFADEPNQGSVAVMPVDLEKSNGDSENGGSSSDQQGTSGNAASVAVSSNDSSHDSANGSNAAGDAGNTSNGIEENDSSANNVSDGSVSEGDPYSGMTDAQRILEGVYVPSEEDAPSESGISAQSVTAGQLASHVIPGLDPENTTVNLFDYSTGKQGSGATAGTDTLGSTAAQTPYANYTTWLTGSNNINAGRLLTFGDGMRHLGYWNQGLVAGYGEVAREHAGMQNIVETTLNNGYPVINANDQTGYNVNTQFYSTASRSSTWSPNEMIYGNAGPLYSRSLANTVGSVKFDPVLGWNIGRAVQAQAQAAADGTTFDFSVFPQDEATASSFYKGAFAGTSYGVDWATGSDLSTDIRSLQYLFDPDTSAPGKESYKDVTGLFQMDDQGYYYYNMRKNFAEFVNDPQGDSSGHFTLYDAPAGLRADGDENSVGGFFPFNSAEKAFKLGPNGQLENNLRADNNMNPSGTSAMRPDIVNEEPVDHHLGMTVETTFRQPIDGKVGSNDMTFEFSGDDDVWVFIDDVLVLDLGGIHSEIYGTINFATGDVNIGNAFDTNGEIFDADGNYLSEPIIKTNLREKFAEAGKADEVNWHSERNTFSSSTSHTLKMFYLERGNYDSSISLKFNLQPQLYQQLKKVDQNGEPLEGAEFDLYATNVPAGTNAQNAQDVTLDQVSTRGECIAHVVTDADGMAKFTDPNGRTGTQDPFNFSDRYDGGSEGLLYILRETKAPAGYKSVPSDLLLRFNPQNTMLVVNNRYQTGAYASFNSYVTGNNGSVYYGQIGENGEVVTKIPDDQLGGAASANVPLDSQQSGLVVAVPMLKQPNYHSDRAWFPLYGDNLVGFQTVHIGDLNADATQYRKDNRTSALTAALMQSAEHYRSDHHFDNAHTEGWYLDWNDETSRLEGTLQNLPGRADRYILTNPDGDMRMYYALIEPDALARVLGVSEDEVRAMSTTERYDALGRVAMEAVDADNGAPGDSIDGLVQKIDPYPESFQDRGFTALDISEFIRNFRSVLYVPNEQRQLRVTKIDQNGVAKNGAEFALFNSEDDARNDRNRLAAGYTATVDGSDGMLIFEPRQSHTETSDGYADMAWPNVTFEGGAATYYLKETRAPAGCDINDTVIPVKVGVYSIYADAGTPDDNVSVSAGVGKLTQTMVQYASEGDVNITLRDITSFAQSQPSGSFGLQDWEDVYLSDTGSAKVPRSMNLHYGLNAVVDYGLSDEDGGKNIQPFFVTDSGYLRTRVQQNLHAHDDPNDPDHSDAAADDLGDMDITSLFSLINTVIVTDSNETAPAAGDLSISKKVEGNMLSADQYNSLFHFTLHIYDQNGTELPNTQRYYFYGKDRVGFIGSGDEIPLHHDEDLVVMGIPEGYTYKVVETDADQDGLFVSPIGGTIEGEMQKDAVFEAAFTNSQDKPKEPDNPDNPDNPNNPNNPNEPNGSDGDGDGSLLAKMGDCIPYALVVIALVAAGAAVVVKRRAGGQGPIGKHGRL